MTGHCIQARLPALGERENDDALARRRRLRRWLLLALLAIAALQTGCVTRRLTIRSNPPGAMVYVDDYEVGLTPVSVSYTYYGTRKIRLVKSGFETITVMQQVPTPWYQFFPLDFVSENLVPFEIRDERGVDFTLVPQRLTPQPELRRNAEELRRSVQTGGPVGSQGPLSTLPVSGPASPSLPAGAPLATPPPTGVPVVPGGPAPLPAPATPYPGPYPPPARPRGPVLPFQPASAPRTSIDP